MNSYVGKTPKFTREQLIFVADVMIAAAVDAIDASRPSFSGAPKKEFNQHWGGILNKLSWDLSILFAQVTGDGIGCSDVIDGFKLDKFLDECAKSQKYSTSTTLTTKIATKFVDHLFKDYLECFSQEEMKKDART